MADRAHPHVVATGGPDSATHLLCPQGPSDLSTHHLVPSGPARGRVQRCRYCGKPEAQIRAENGL